MKEGGDQREHEGRAPRGRLMWESWADAQSSLADMVFL